MENIVIDKLVLDEKDVAGLGISDEYSNLRRLLYRAAERSDCILIQGAAFVLNGKAFLVMGVGGIDFLDALGRSGVVDGIIGNGNAVFLSRDFKAVYSAHSVRELTDCYELEGSGSLIRFLDGAEMGPLVFLLRSFHSETEYDAAKRKAGQIRFDTENAFAGPPTRFAGSWKSRLRGKFVATARVVHCARRPSLKRTECLFDSAGDVVAAINHFQGAFQLVYTRWSQDLCDAVGMRKTRLVSVAQSTVTSVSEYMVQVAKEL